ncbi:hypothetical protein KP509_24G026700 [Ceratopteris richardii]|nr:hypothetical protein KP509_24G026700 [Ceratopteris richardii]
MYARLGALEKARRVLDQHPRGNIFSWTALIAGYAHYEQGDNAFLCFQQMQNEGISPDPMTFTCLLKAAGSMGALDRGEQVHQDIYKQGLLWNNATLVSALIDMYAKCGSFKKAEDILTTFEIQNIVAWSALIAGYVQHGQGEEAIKLYGRMQQKCIIPNVVTFTSILKACGSIQAVSTGEKIHNEIVQHGLFGRDMVLGNALVDMYIKCGALAKARRVFEELPAQDVVTWSALIAGYAEQGQDEEALQCYDQMQAHGLSPNAVTYTCILKVCGNTGLFGKGKQIHEQIVKSNLLADNLQLGTALLDFYVKCGALADAQEVLKCLPVQDSVACTALIAGYSRLGQAENALGCLRHMQQNGLSLTEVTSTCVLYAYSHSGLVDEGFTYFANMVSNDKVRLNMVHYSCLIDLFGRAGDLEKATALAETIPSLEHGFVWPTLLNACQKIKDVDVARWAFENAMQMDNFPSALFISMANMY